MYNGFALGDLAVVAGADLRLATWIGREGGVPV